MGIKRHPPEEIVTKLRQVEVLVGCPSSYKSEVITDFAFLGRPPRFAATYQAVFA